MAYPHLLARTAAVLSAGVLAAACGGTTNASDPAVAQELAQSADEVAVLLDQGQDCEARQAADHLVAAAREAEAQGQLASAIADDVVATTVTATADVTCTPEVQADPPSTSDDDDKGNSGDKGKSKGKGKKKGKD